MILKVDELVNLELSYLTASRHAKKPYNMGKLDDFNGHAKITGPCGDTMEFWLKVQDDRVKRVSFITDGCNPSIASGSMTTFLAEGKLLEEVKSINQQDVLKALEGLPEDHEHCALLATNTLKAACEDYLLKEKKIGGE